MNKAETYRKLIRQVLENMQGKALAPGFTEYDEQLVIDDEKGHFYLMSLGWKADERMHGCVAHIDLKGDKIWIQRDGTDWGIVTDFLELGVPREDIVLAFHAPYKRPYTGFAVT